MELWPANQAAWNAWKRVGNVLQSGGFGPAYLDTGGILKTLHWQDMEPADPEARDELLRSLQIIHDARVAALKESAHDGE